MLSKLCLNFASRCKILSHNPNLYSSLLKKPFSSKGDSGSVDDEESQTLKDLYKDIEIDEQKSNQQKLLENEKLVNDLNNDRPDLLLGALAYDPLTGLPVKKKPIKFELNGSLNVRKNFAQPVEEQMYSNTETAKKNLTKLETSNHPIIDKAEDFIQEFVNNLMKKGEKESAQKLLSSAIMEIYRKTEGKLNITPKQILEEVVNKASPLFKINKVNITKIKVKLCPVPLSLREQRRIGIKWLLDASEKHLFKEKYKQIAYEMLLVLNGTSNVLKRKAECYGLVIQNRSNIIVSKK